MVCQKRAPSGCQKKRRPFANWGRLVAIIVFLRLSNESAEKRRSYELFKGICLRNILILFIPTLFPKIVKNYIKKIFLYSLNFNSPILSLPESKKSKSRKFSSFLVTKINNNKYFTNVRVVCDHLLQICVFGLLFLF